MEDETDVKCTFFIIILHLSSNMKCTNTNVQMYELAISAVEAETDLDFYIPCNLGFCMLLVVGACAYACALSLYLPYFSIHFCSRVLLKSSG